MYFLEQNAPFSQSLLWKLQRDYFQNSGISAWSTQTVPLYVTNNPAVARSYAAIVLACLEQADAGPVHIIEIGAGAGRLAFLLLRQLELLLGGDAPRVPFRYVLTDFAERNVAFCREHPQLRPFRERGWLDFAVFDAERDRSLTLMDSRAEIGPASLKTPLLAIANYVFDGLESDVFRMRDGSLCELRLNIESELESELESAAGLEEAHGWLFRFSQAPGLPDRYPEAWTRLLLKHGESSDGAAFLFPMGALRSIDGLRRLTSGPLTLLACDQFRDRESFVDAEGAPKILFHGSFSVPVNFSLIRDYFEESGGFAAMPTFNYSGVVPFIGGTCPASGGLKREIHRSFEAAGPDLFFTLRRALETHFDSIAAPATLSLLRATGFDPYVLEHALKSLDQHLALAMPLETDALADLVAVVDGCWANYFAIGEPCDLARRIGLLLYRVGEYRRAFEFFRQDLRLHGETGETMWNMGLCLFALGDLEGASGYFGDARSIATDLVPPRLGEMQLPSL